MPGKSLQELDGSTTPGSTDITPEKTAADLAAEQQKQEEVNLQRLAELKGKEADQLTEEEKTELAALEKKPEADATGNPEESEEEEGKEGEEDNENPEDFWKDVDALHGEALEVEYKDADGNDIDPVSPEGAVLRDKAVEKRAIGRFEEYLSKSDPRGYAYLLHRKAGGTDEDFFGKKVIALPDYEEFKESVDLQQKVYRDSLVRKGVNEKQVKLLVDQAVKDKEIFELADTAYKEYDESQKAELEKTQKALEKQEKEYEARVKELDTLVTSEIGSNKSMKFIVPESHKAPFTQFVKSHIQEHEGKFLIVQEINDKDISRLLESMYLLYRKGDLNSIVTRKATSIQASNMKRLVRKSTAAPGGKTDPPPSTKKPLGEL